MAEQRAEITAIVNAAGSQVLSLKGTFTPEDFNNQVRGRLLGAAVLTINLPDGPDVGLQAAAIARAIVSWSECYSHRGAAAQASGPRRETGKALRFKQKLVDTLRKQYADLSYSLLGWPVVQWHEPVCGGGGTGGYPLILLSARVMVHVASLSPPYPSKGAVFDVLSKSVYAVCRDSAYKGKVMLRVYLDEIADDVGEEFVAYEYVDKV